MACFSGVDALTQLTQLRFEASCDSMLLGNFLVDGPDFRQALAVRGR